ncbi:MAG: hypothetical protein ACK5JH_07655 [Anaerocolumna sp.]
MKGSIFKSFRFEIILYSLLSLVYALLTEAVLSFGIYLIYRILKGNEKSDILMNGLPEAGQRLEQNSLVNNYELTNRAFEEPGAGVLLPEPKVLVVLVSLIVALHAKRN